MALLNPARSVEIPLALMGLCLATVVAEAQTVPAAAGLQPHRIAYEVTLDPARSPGNFADARGLMVLEFTGNACDGYATNFRQVTDLAGADGDRRQLDFRVNLWEGEQGKRFRFAMRNTVNGRLTRDADGEATRNRDGSIAVRMKKPRGQRSDLDGAALFPSAMTLDLIAAAQAGKRSFSAQLFDGSEGGEKVYDVAATIGGPLAGERQGRLEPVMRGKNLDQLARWPITVSYFETTPGDRVPVYRMKSITFANGVLSDLVFEFPEFSLAARAVRYEELPREACNR